VKLLSDRAAMMLAIEQRDQARAALRGLLEVLGPESFEREDLADAIDKAGDVLGLCRGCGCPADRCRPLWAQQRKCCPDCSCSMVTT